MKTCEEYVVHTLEETKKENEVLSNTIARLDKENTELNNKVNRLIELIEFIMSRDSLDINDDRIYLSAWIYRNSNNKEYQELKELWESKKNEL